MIKSERGEHMPGFEEIVGHEQIVTHLKSAMKLGKVSHAYILSGEKGCGKKLLADVFAETLQCEKGGTEPCGSCHSCVQAQSGNHPDIIHLMHEKPNSISVDDVRTQIVNDVLIKPYSGKYKIYIVPDAEKMTAAAQNALLKTIEEPPAYAVILLLANNASALLPTILSRCVMLSLKPVADDKVVFTREINAPSLSKAQIYQQLLKWGQENFNTKESRVAYQNEAKGEIAIIGEEYIVFSSTALSLDRAMMKYRIIIECKEHACNLQLAGIRYEYNVSYQNEPEKYLAEEWITDEYALNKSKTKLNRISGKFRKATIDFADKTFDSAANALGAQLLTAATVEPVSAPQRETRPVAPMEGFVAFQADKIPSTILQMLPDNALQIKAVKGNTTDANVEWKGIGNMFGKTISTISISKDSPAYKAIGNNDVYRLSFSKPGTSADAPWIIIECRKQGETSEGQQTMLIGEITNVWIK